jgi:curli production assembly/transport component CsgE
MDAFYIEMSKIKIIALIGTSLLFFFTLGNSFGQDTIVISPYDTAAIKNMPEKIESIIRKYQEEKKQKKISLEEENGESISLELDGLIIDETITKIGHDFYKYFHDYWNAPEGVTNYTLYISEKLMPGMGNLVIVEIDEKKVFQNRITPRDYVIEQTAKYATNRTNAYLKQYQLIQKQLEQEDMSGTGIY